MDFMMHSMAHSMMHLMKEAFNEAQKALGISDPNPAVGAIVADSNQNIMGRGHTQEVGGAHAEVMALNDAALSFANLSNSVLYVTLEPCSHYGRTAPCTIAIEKSGIRKVVIARKDPSEKIQGISYLKSIGIEVSVIPDDVFMEEVFWTLGPFFTGVKTKKPRVYLKWAQTTKGNLGPPKGKSGNITSAASREVVHRLRRKFHATLVTPGTVRVDSPSLNIRDGALNLKGIIKGGSFLTNMLLDVEESNGVLNKHKGKLIDKTKEKTNGNSKDIIIDQFKDILNDKADHSVRYFMLPSFTKEWDKDALGGFLLKQSKIGGNFRFLVDNKNLYDQFVDRGYHVIFTEDFNNVDSWLKSLYKDGVTQLMIEAGPAFAELLTVKHIPHSYLCFSTFYSPDWDEQGRGFSLSQQLSKMLGQKSQQQILSEFFNEYHRESIGIKFKKKEEYLDIFSCFHL